MAWQEQRTLARHTAYVNLVFEYGDVSPKERIGQVLAPEKKRAVYVPKLAVGPERNRNPLRRRGLRFDEIGSGGRTRTYDMVVNSHPLCQLSYTGTRSGQTSQNKIACRDCQ